MDLDYSKLVNGLRTAFASGRTLNEEFRRHNLEQLLRLYEENTDELLEALQQDLGKSRHEASIFEIEYIKNELRSTLHKLHKWMNPPKPSKNRPHYFDDVKLLREPLGVVLVIGPFNYPIKLVTLPAHGAIAAGNCVIMKPSHLTPRSSELLAALVSKYLDQDCYKVVLADSDGTSKLLEQRFDSIFASCTPSTGRLVAEAAARQMTPVTLQMGSKCPVYLDEGISNMERAVKRLVFAKMVNMGQMCMSPDYLICSPKTRDLLVPLFQKYVRILYGDNPRKCKDLGRIINKKNTKRLEYLIRSTKGQVVIGGDVDIEDRWVSPTLVLDVPIDDILMEEEIFGPILPVILVKDALDAVDFIKARGGKPLAINVFSEDKETHRLFSRSTSSGAVSINDCIVYAGVEDLPFGGVGNSGMGHKYHGVHSFLAFTHEKGCLVRKLTWFSEFVMKSRYPPGTNRKTATCNFLRKARKPIDFTPLWILLFFIGFVMYSVKLAKLVQTCFDYEANADSWPCDGVRLLQGLNDFFPTN